MTPLNPDNIILNSRAARLKVASTNHLWFFIIYFFHYIRSPMASFHHDFFAITEAVDNKMLVIMAFRGSGKSTIFTTSYPIWAILGTQQRKFVLILSQTQAQAELHMKNLRDELETNQLLRDDFGALDEEADQWGLKSIVIPKYGARITIGSREQSLRGLRNRQYRPDLIICDDMEDLNSVKTKESRDATFAWLTGDIIPMGQIGKTKLVLVGTPLHNDSLLMRLRDNIAKGELNGQFFNYPLVNDEEVIAWPSAFPSMADVENLRKDIGSEASFQREFMLRIMPDEEQVVYPEWIKYYDTLPPMGSNGFRYAAIGIDPAISESNAADYTAMVAALVFGRLDKLEVYILPNPINKRLTFPDLITRAKTLSISLKRAQIFVEDVAFQRSIVQTLKRDGFPVEGVQLHGQDKRTRLAATTLLLQEGKIMFPRQGSKDIVQALIGFGKENHDDLADAFSILVNKINHKDVRGARAWPKDHNIFFRTSRY